MKSTFISNNLTSLGITIAWVIIKTIFLKIHKLNISFVLLISKAQKLPMGIYSAIILKPVYQRSGDISN